MKSPFAPFVLIATAAFLVCAVSLLGQLPFQDGKHERADTVGRVAVIHSVVVEELSAKQVVVGDHDLLALNLELLAELVANDVISQVAMDGILENSKSKYKKVVYWEGNDAFVESKPRRQNRLLR